MRATLALAKTFLFTVLVPGTVAGLIPYRLRGHPARTHGLQASIALALLTLGVAIYLFTAFWSFAWVGGGTPAPISPTRTLVVSGLHRFMRNPMYVGVLMIVGAQAWLFQSMSNFRYLIGLAIAFHLFVILYEEPALHRQFGEEYERYRTAVPRWIPKLRR